MNNIDYIKEAESWLKRYTGSFVYNEYSQGVLAFARHLAGQHPQPAKEDVNVADINAGFYVGGEKLIVKPKEKCTHVPSINECIECAVRNYKPKESKACEHVWTMNMSFDGSDYRGCGDCGVVQSCGKGTDWNDFYTPPPVTPKSPKISEIELAWTTHDLRDKINEIIRHLNHHE